MGLLHGLALALRPGRLAHGALVLLGACAPTVLPSPDAAADRAPPDVAPDVAGDASTPACRVAADCGAGRRCDTARGRCVECFLQEHCGAGERVCTLGRCVAAVSCTSSRTCPDQVCDLARMRCVDCVGDADCGGLVCRSNLCVAPVACTSSRECSAAGLVCDPSARRCVECVVDGDCTGGRRCNADRICTMGGGCAPGTAFCVSERRARVCDATGTAREMDCAAGETCTGGACRALACAPGTATCADAATRAVCAADGSAVTRVPCAAGESCEAGACRAAPPCPTGETRCGAACVTLSRDDAHCGACGRRCPAGSACAAGACAAVSEVIPPLSGPRWGAGTFVDAGGRIFLFGGYPAPPRDTPLNTTEVYDPASGRWSLRTMPVRMGSLCAAGLADGRFFIANAIGTGNVLPQGWLYDPAADRWAMSRTTLSLYYVTMARADDGAAYLFGGSDTSATAPPGTRFVHRYTPADDTTTRLGALVSPSRDSQSVLTRDGRIVVLGGLAGNVIEAFTPSTGAVTTLPVRLPTPRIGGAAVLGPDGRIYYAGGFHTLTDSTWVPITEVVALDPATNTLTTLAPMPEHRAWFSFVVRPGGRLVAIGGYNRVGDTRRALSTTVTYNIAADRWD